MNLIGREELKQKLDNGDKFKLVNALGEWAFEAKRIPGSITNMFFEYNKETLVHPDIAKIKRHKCRYCSFRSEDKEETRKHSIHMHFALN